MEFWPKFSLPKTFYTCVICLTSRFTSLLSHSLFLNFQMVLVSPTAEQYDSLLRHLREQIDEGCGETIYVVGMGSGEEN